MEKNVLVLASTNVRLQTNRFLIAIAAIFGYKIWSQGVSQAYLYSASRLTRDVYIKPTVIRLQSDQLLKLLKPLYELADSGDFRNATSHLPLRMI